jgi:hypothetical protein
MGRFTVGTDERRFLCGSKLEYRCEIGIYKSVFLEIYFFIYIIPPIGDERWGTGLLSGGGM